MIWNMTAEEKRKQIAIVGIYVKICSEMIVVASVLMASIFHCSKVANAVADALRTEN